MTVEKTNAIAFLLKIYARHKGIGSPECEFKIGYVTYTWDCGSYKLIADVFCDTVEGYFYNINSTAPAVNYWALPGEIKRYTNDIPDGIYDLFRCEASGKTP